MAILDHRVVLERAEARLADPSVSLADALAGVPLDVVGLLYLERSLPYPRLAAALPPLPSDDVQRSWTGTSGLSLMTQSCAFVKGAVERYEALTGRSIRAAQVLDYGCGWGRLTRLMLRHVDADHVWALDPSEEALRLCREARLPVRLERCDDMPASLPVGDTTFDFAFAFSVFTHLSERCASTVLGTLHRYLRPDALLAVTVRPPEYWDVHSPYPPGKDKAAMRSLHQRRGFAFIPHQRAPIDGEVTYGDTSISLDYVASRWRSWEIAGTQSSSADPYQVVIYLRPRPV